MPIHIKIEAAKLHEQTKAEGTRYDRAMELRHWIHLSKHITIIEGQEKTTHSLQVYTDGSKSEDGVGSRIAVFAGTNLITQKYRLNGRCSNNQAEQLTVLKALECIQSRQEVGKTIIVYTDSGITLQLLTNHKRHTFLIDKVRIKVMEMERNEWMIEFSWIKAHAEKEMSWQIDWLRKHQSAATSMSATAKSLRAQFQRS